MAAPRLLVVGAGMTGAAVVQGVLRRAPKAVVTVWEQQGNPGGRMKTNHTAEGRVPYDAGAQYWSPKTASVGHSAMLELWKARGLVREFADIVTTQEGHMDLTHYAAQQGMQSLVEAALTGADVQYNRRLAKVEAGEGGKVKATCADGESVLADGIVLAGPPMLDVEFDLVAPLDGSGEEAKEGTASDGGGGDEAKEETAIDGSVGGRHADDPDLGTAGGVFDALRGVQYSQRYSLALLYRDHSAASLRDVFKATSTYVKEAAVRYVCVDALRRAGGHRAGEAAHEGGGTGPVVVLVHAGTPFTAESLAEGQSVEVVQGDMLETLRRCFDGFPEPDAMELELLSPSQLLKGPFRYDDSVNALRLRSHNVVFAGDHFTFSNIDGCISSAESAVRLLLEPLLEAE